MYLVHTVWHTIRLLAQFLVELMLNDNSFSGTLPTDLMSSRHLTVLQVQRNILEGSISFTSDLKLLTTVDISDNRFSGTLPASVFTLPSLEVFAATTNCFTGALPETICNATRLETLVLDGLQVLSRRIPNRNLILQY